MNTRRLLVSVLMLVSVLLSACAPAATPTIPTIVPPTVAPAVVATTVASITPSKAKVIAEWKVSDPGSIAVGFNSIWVAGHHSYTTTRFDPASNTVIAVIKETGWQAEQTLAVGDVLWVTGHIGDTTWIDPKTNTVTTTVPPVKGKYHYIAYGFNSLWATDLDDRLARIDPATSQIIASIELGDGIEGDNNDVLVTATAVWVDHLVKQELIKIDPVTNSILSKTPYSKLISDAQALATGPAGKGTDFIWRIVTGGLLRMDPTTGAGLTFMPMASDQFGWASFAVTEDAVWLAGEGQINRVNVATNQIDATYATDTGGTYICIGFGSVWLANYDKSLVQRLDVVP